MSSKSRNNFLKQRKDENIPPFRFTNDCCFMSSVNNRGSEEKLRASVTRSFSIYESATIDERLILLQD
jgi:hypothetical protein